MVDIKTESPRFAISVGLCDGANWASVGSRNSRPPTTMHTCLLAAVSHIPDRQRVNAFLSRSKRCGFCPTVVHGSILCDPIQPNPSADWPNPTQLTTGGKIWTQPNTTNNRAYSLVVTYFYTQNLSLNCLMKPNLIQPCFKCINVVLSNF